MWIKLSNNRILNLNLITSIRNNYSESLMPSVDFVGGTNLKISHKDAIVLEHAIANFKVKPLILNSTNNAENTTEMPL